ASGSSVAVHCRRVSDDVRAFQSALANRGAKVVVVDADLRDPDVVRGLPSRAAEQMGGPLTGLVNNASVFDYDRPESVNDAVFDNAMQVNLKAPLLLSEAFAKQADPAANNCIVHILDQKLWNPNPDFFSYTLTKYALLGATRMMAMSFAPTVRV